MCLDNQQCAVGPGILHRMGGGGTVCQGAQRLKGPLKRTEYKKLCSFTALRSSDRRQYPMKLEITTLSLLGGGGDYRVVWAHRLYAFVDSSADEVIVTGRTPRVPFTKAPITALRHNQSTQFHRGLFPRKQGGGSYVRCDLSVLHNRSAAAVVLGGTRSRQCNKELNHREHRQPVFLLTKLHCFK